MSLKVGEIGKIIRIDTDYNLSANSELTLVFTKPDGSTLTKTKTLDNVTAPAVDATDPDTSEVFLANQYAEYATASGDLDQSGQWAVRVEYEDATPKKYIGDTSAFSVPP